MMNCCLYYTDGIIWYGPLAGGVFGLWEHEYILDMTIWEVYPEVENILIPVWPILMMAYRFLYQEGLGDMEYIIVFNYFTVLRLRMSFVPNQITDAVNVRQDDFQSGLGGQLEGGHGDTLDS